MTSNRPEILDRALVRPGRIDVSVNFGYAKKKLIVEMFQCFYGTQFPLSLTEKLPDEKLTAAEIGQVLFRHFKDPRPAIILQSLIDCSNNVRKEISTEYKKIEKTWEPTEEMGGYATWIPDKELN